MRLYLIRHGQSSNNELWEKNRSEKGRSYDPVLTARGRAQAECAAAFLRDELGVRQPLGGLYADAARPTVLYTSLMTRAEDTASIIGRALNLPVIALSEAHEIGGLYLDDAVTGEKRGVEGPNRAHFEAHFPELQLPEELGERGWWGGRPHEPNDARPERARRVWEWLRARHGAREDVIGLVTHGGFYNHLLAVILDVPVRADVWYTLNNCAISRLDFGERGVALVYLNRFDFMPPELITL